MDPKHRQKTPNTSIICLPDETCKQGLSGLEKIQTALVIFLKLFIVFSHIIIYTEFAMSGLELRLVGGSEIRFRTKTG